MNRFRQQRLNERLQQRMDARSQAPQVAEVHAVIPDLSFMAPLCLTFLGQERPSSTFTRLAMLSLILSLGLAACSPAEASPTAVSPAPQVTLEPTFTLTFAPTFTPVPPATLESSPNAPATQEAVLLGTLDALVRSGITAEKSGEGWILSTTDANAQRVELGEIKKVGDSYWLVFTTTEGNPGSENLALATYDETSSWVISEPDHQWPVYRLTEQGWEQLLFPVNPDAAKFQDPDGNVINGIQEHWTNPEEGTVWMNIFGYGQSLQVKEEDITFVQRGVIWTLKEQRVITTVVIPIEGSTWGVPVDLVSNVGTDKSGNVVEGASFYPDGMVFYPAGFPEAPLPPYRQFSHDEFRAYLTSGAPVFFDVQKVVDLLKLLEGLDKGPGGSLVVDVNNFLLLQGIDAKCSSREECVELLDEKKLTEKYTLGSWGLTPHFVDELRVAIQGQSKIPLSRIRLQGSLQGIGEP